MPTHASFTTSWKITWPEFENIQRKKISTVILPSYKNVVFRFRLELSGSVQGNDAQKIGMSAFYEDGPLRSLDDCTMWYHLRNDTKILAEFYAASYQANRGGVEHWPNFEDKDINKLKEKYGLTASDNLHYSITIAIPLTAFDYKVWKPDIEQRPRWFTRIFERLENVEKADFSDVRLVGGDGGTFYCHKIIVGEQSKELEKMLKNPTSEAEKLGFYCFPSLDTRSLHSILEYLYTGEYDLLTKLPVPLIIQVANYSEKYGLKALKKACIGQLWEFVVEDLEYAIDILRYADLHPDAKYLKDRAMDVIMENYEKLPVELRDFSGGKYSARDRQGNRLKEEFVLYTLRRPFVTLW